MADILTKSETDENKLVITHDAPKSEFTMEQLVGARDAAQVELDKWQALIDEAVGLGVKPKP